MPILSAKISTRLTGFIIKLTKYEGDPVKEGELLVEIEAKELYTRLVALKSELRAAQTELLTRKSIFLRNKELLAHEAISKEAFDLSKSAYCQAKSKLEQIKQEIASLNQDLSYARLTAPFSGFVIKRFKEPGELAVPGAPLLEIENPRAGYRLLVKIPQEKAPEIFPGAKAYINLGPKRMITLVFRIHPAVGDDGLATVEIRLKKVPFGLPSGSSVGVDLVLAEPEGFIVPLKALVSGKTKGVYVVRKGRINFVPVKVLGKTKDLLVCQGEFFPEEVVVLGDPGFLLRLHPGQKVNPRSYEN